MYELRRDKFLLKRPYQMKLKMVQIDLQEVIKIGMLTRRSPIKDGKPQI